MYCSRKTNIEIAIAFERRYTAGTRMSHVLPLVGILTAIFPTPTVLFSTRISTVLTILGLARSSSGCGGES